MAAASSGVVCGAGRQMPNRPSRLRNSTVVHPPSIAQVVIAGGNHNRAPGAYPADESSSTRQISPMSTIPTRPASPTTGRCRKPAVTIVVAASRMLVVAAMTVGSGVMRSWIRTSFTSLPSATARLMSASVIRPIGCIACSSSRTTSAVSPAWFIRYAAAARWALASTVVSAGLITSAAVAGAWGCCAGSSANGPLRFPGPTVIPRHHRT